MVGGNEIKANLAWAWPELGNNNYYGSKHKYFIKVEQGSNSIFLAISTLIMIYCQHFICFAATRKKIFSLCWWVGGKVTMRNRQKVCFLLRPDLSTFNNLHKTSITEITIETYKTNRYWIFVQCSRRELWTINAVLGILLIPRF